MMTEMTDGELAAAAQDGDLQAYNILIERHQQLAYNVAYRIMGNADAAMDAVQDAFLRGYRALPSFRGGSFKAWILRITTNRCYDKLRAQKRHPHSGFEDLVENPEHSWLMAGDGEQPEEYVQRRELDGLIQNGLESLPEDQRTVLVLCDVEGMSYNEIAEATTTALGTVKSRLSRARAKMRDYLMERRELLPAEFRPIDG